MNDTPSTPEPSAPTADPPLSSAHGMHPHEPMIRRGAFDPPSAPGTLGRLDGFDILRLLGEGGMGQVYLAHESITEAQVAIKIMKPQTADDPQEVHRFLTEARHMYQLSNPRILRVLKISDRQEGPYYVMPYLEGGNLMTQYKPGQPIPTEKILAVAQQLAEALAYAHAHGLIHRDIKPGNVLLDKEGNAYLTDFGLVRTVFNDSMIDAAASHLEGTAPYMSPVVARGQAEDTRCDIYAFGALLYELLTGQPPYTARTPQMILDQILKGPPPPIRSVNSKASPALVKIAEGCMARELRDRYASMADVLSDLSRTAMGKTPLGPHRRKRGLPCSPALALGALATALGMTAVVYLSSLDFSTVAQKAETDSPPASVSAMADSKSSKGLGLVAWWPGDGNADDVIGNRKGESVKGADYGPGIDGQAFRIDGKGQYFRVPQDPALAFTNGAPFTLEAWVFRTNDSLPFHVMGKRGPVDTGTSYYQMGYDYRDPDVPMNVWTHLAVVFPAAEDPSKCMVKSYMNGELTSLQRCHTRIGPNDADLHIGFSGPFGGFAGRIDNLRIYDRALSDGEVKALHDETASRVPYYPDDTSRTTDPPKENPPEHFKFTTENGTATITKYIGPGGVVVIPKVIDGCPVVAIGDSAFRNRDDITRVTFPETVNHIREWAFWSCDGLTNIDIPDGMACINLWWGSFGACGRLNNVTLPARRTMLLAPFISCYRLTSVDVHPDNPNYRSSSGVVFSKDMSQLICYPGGLSGKYTVPSGTKTIADGSFQGCISLPMLTIPDSVTHMGVSPFYNCRELMRVLFKGNAPKPINENNTLSDAFAYAPKVVVYYQQGTEGWGDTFAGRPTAMLEPEEDRLRNEEAGAQVGIRPLMENGAFGFPQSQSDVLCDDPALKVSVWNNNRHLIVQAIVWGDGNDALGQTGDNRQIGDYSDLCLDVDADQKTTPHVDRTYSLNPQPNLPGLRYQVAFSETESSGFQEDSRGRGDIRYVDVGGNRRVRVDTYAIPLDEISKKPGASIRLAYFARSPQPQMTLDSVGFRYDEKNDSNSIPKNGYHGVTLAERSDTINIDMIPEGRRIKAPSDVTAKPGPSTPAPKQIADLPKEDANRHLQFSTENGTVTITKYTGSDSEVTIPSTMNGIPVTEIGNMAFVSCSNLISLTLPVGLKRIGRTAISRCNALTRVTIPDGVTTIEAFAFEANSKLASLSLPGSVTTIDKRAFSYCKSLQAVYFEGNAPSLGSDDVFYGNANTIVYYRAGTKGWGDIYGGRPTAVWNDDVKTDIPQ